VPDDGCCYIHNTIKRLEHGVDVGAAEAATGLRSDARCASRHEQTLPKAITPKFSKAARADRKLATKLDVIAHPAVRRELRKLYDAAPVRRPAPRDCEYRMHVRRGDVRRGGRRPVLCGDSLPSTRRRPRNGGLRNTSQDALTHWLISTQAAMKKYDVKRVAVVTSIGAGDSKDQAPFMFKMLMMTVMSSIFADKNNQEALFTDGGVGRDLEWCIVRPGGLTVEKPTGVINVIEGEAGSIARADVADFCIGAILEKDFPYIQKTPCISSVGGTSWVKDRSAAAREGMTA
jgi:hypothetical protein